MEQLNLDSKKSMVSMLTVIGILLGILVLLLLIGRSANGSYNAGIIFAMTLDGLLIVLLIVGMLVVWHTNRQRTLARRAGQEGLAATQPIAHENALPLPTSIELRVSKAKYILFQAVFWALFYTTYMVLANSQDPLSLRRLLLIFLITLLTGALFGLLMFYFIGRHMGQTLVVDDQGISILHSRGNRHIDWQTAQFFGVHYDKKSHTTGLYELSNETTTVTWRWYSPLFTHPFHFSRLTIPFDDYTHTMEALLSVVADRTHLPLHEFHDYTTRMV